MDARKNLEAESEHRKFVRISNNFLVRSCKAGSFDSGDIEKTAGIVRDINLAGLAFLTNEIYRQGDVLELEIEFVGLKYSQSPKNGLLNSAVILVQANAVRVENLETGLTLVAVLFEPMDDEDQVILQQAVSYQQTIEEGSN